MRIQNKLNLHLRFMKQRYNKNIKRKEQKLNLHLRFIKEMYNKNIKKKEVNEKWQKTKEKETF